jgi:hypothetical protein
VLEVADIFRRHGPAWRQANAGHVSLGQLKVMSAIENGRTAALGGHVARCENAKCGHTQIAYNSYRNRHCPDTLITIAADPKHLGARIGALSVLHTWGSALTHHPHVHMIVPGGGISLDGERWITCRGGFFLPVRVLSRLFRRLVMDKLAAAHATGALQFFGKHAALSNAPALVAYLAPLRNSEWVVYSKRPFGGPAEVLRCLARYTHRVTISNRRLVSLDDGGPHLQVEGLSPRWSRAIRDDDARYRRVRAPLPDARLAGRLPSHPLLWPADQPHPRQEYCMHPQAARNSAHPD